MFHEPNLPLPVREPLANQLMADVHAYGLAREKLGEARQKLRGAEAGLGSGDWITNMWRRELVEEARGDIAHWETHVDRHDDIVKASLDTLCEFFTGKDQRPVETCHYCLAELEIDPMTNGWVTKDLDAEYDICEQTHDGYHSPQSAWIPDA
jgi:hypothetical protein